MRSDALTSATRIVDAARKVFASGDGSGPLDLIASEAGVGIATLYRHFPNRQLLAKAVFDRVFDSEVAPLLERFGEPGAERAALVEVLEQVTDIAVRERDLIASMGNLGPAVAEAVETNLDAFEPLLTAARTAGNVRDDITLTDVPQLIAMLTVALTAIELDPATRRRYLDMLLDALISPAAATGSPAAPRSGAISAGSWVRTCACSR